MPLAMKGAEITVVEPADGMVAVLKDNMRESGISSIQIIQARWEDIDPSVFSSPFDLAVACFSLGMRDISTSIKKIQAVTKGEVHLVWFQQQTGWEELMAELWPKIHGTEYQPGPKAVLLFNVLSQMGIAPQVSNRNYFTTSEYNSLEEAVSDVVERVGPVSEEKIPVIRDYISKKFSHSEWGYLWRGEMCVSMFSWKEPVLSR
jgi:ubiquinone/menaquinone biosynthesis C-methylase UbiE